MIKGLCIIKSECVVLFKQEMKAARSTKELTHIFESTAN